MPSILTFNVNVAPDGDRAVVTFASPSRWRVTLGHEAALLLARAIMRQAHNTKVGEIPAGWRVEHAERTNGKRQVVIGAPNGRYSALDPKAALVVGQALHSKAQYAADWNNAQQLAEDQAMLLRMGGLPTAEGGRLAIGLTAHPKILDLAANIAVNDHDLRRFMPGGVHAKGHFPPPSVWATTMPAGSGRLDPSKILPPKEPTP